MMSNLRLAYDSNDYLKISIRVLYSTYHGIRAYDLTQDKEADITFGGIVGEYSTISGHEYPITVHRDYIKYI